MHTVQTISAPQHYLKAITLEQLLRAFKLQGTHIPRTGEEAWGLLVGGLALGVTSGHILSMTFLQSLPFVISSYNFMGPSSRLYPEQSAKGFH